MLNLEQTCNNPHPHSLARTVIRPKLSAWACQPFCCQRTFYPSRSECPECLRTCLAGLSGSPCCELAFQHCPSFFWDFASCLSCPATRFGNPLRNFPLATATNHDRKIKNPASSAGRNHPHLSGSTRCSTSFYPVLVKNPTIGSTSRLRFSRAGRLLRSDCDAPERSPQLHGALGPSAILSAFRVSSSPQNNYLGWVFLSPVDSRASPLPARTLGSWPRGCTAPRVYDLP
jgi:hypothetical protein